MAILLLIILHWYSSLFFQSFFHHRYAAHNLFTMSRFWEKTFFFCCYITQGSSYISAAAYGKMHRLHHAHTDTDQDPHSPHFSLNMFTLLWKTRNSYNDIFKGADVEAKYCKDLPEWDAFDRIAHNWISRVIWGAVYVALYIWLATAWWQFLFLPITFAMGALQGVAVNWWAHKFGYENFPSKKETSKNILPVDLVFWGEAYHNNHHKHPGRVNNAIRWFEFDPAYQVMRFMNYVKIIRFRKAVPAPVLVKR